MNLGILFSISDGLFGSQFWLWIIRLINVKLLFWNFMSRFPFFSPPGLIYINRQMLHIRILFLISFLFRFLFFFFHSFKNLFFNIFVHNIHVCYSIYILLSYLKEIWMSHFQIHDQNIMMFATFYTNRFKFHSLKWC